MTTLDVLVLIAGGIVAGIVNTLAGGGSLISVPLLVFLGVPGTLANGTNRVGVFLQSVTAAWRFGSEGVPGVRLALPILLPLMLGSAGGAYVVSILPDRTFEQLFGVVMVGLLIPLLMPRSVARESDAPPKIPWSRTVSFFVFLAIGIYGGAVQAGVGIAILIALAYAGYDLVQANSIKVVVNAALTSVAIPVFLWQGQVLWVPAIVLAIGFIIGAALGVRLSVRGGERIVRPVFTLMVLVLAAKMLGLY